jgi:hypothetical protein
LYIAVSELAFLAWPFPSHDIPVPPQEMLLLHLERYDDFQPTNDAQFMR